MKTYICNPVHDPGCIAGVIGWTPGREDLLAIREARTALKRHRQFDCVEVDAALWALSPTDADVGGFNPGDDGSLVEDTAGKEEIHAMPGMVWCIRVYREGFFLRGQDEDCREVESAEIPHDWAEARLVEAMKDARNPSEIPTEHRSVHQMYADLQGACDALDDLDDCADGHTRHERQLDALERIVRAVDGLLRQGLTLAQVRAEVHEAEDAYDHTYGKLDDFDLVGGGLPPEQAARIQTLPAYFNDIDTLKECGRA